MSRKAFQCNVAVFRDQNHVQTVVLPDGFRFIPLIRGSTPKAADIDEPGEYEVDALDLGGAEYPVALCVVDLAHVPAWERLTVADVGRMLNRVTAFLTDHDAKLPRSVHD